MRGIFPMAVALASVGAFAQDVVKLAPEQVKVVFENDRVRVLHFNEPATQQPSHAFASRLRVGGVHD